MNLKFFILCAIVIITPNIINAKISKYDNYTCYGACCRKANKPSNYSDTLIEYSIDFTVDEVVVTVSIFILNKFLLDCFVYLKNTFMSLFYLDLAKRCNKI